MHNVTSNCSSESDSASNIELSPILSSWEGIRSQSLRTRTFIF